MAAYLHKTANPVDYRPSVDATNIPGFVAANWFQNPDVSAVYDSVNRIPLVPYKYWALPLADPVTEMTQGEKDAVDAAEAAAVVAAERSEAVMRASLDIGTRELVESLLFEINKCNTRLQELQDSLTSVKGTVGGSDNIRAAIPDPSATSNAAPSAFTNVNPKLRSQVLQDYVDGINAGNSDPV